jgi:hypothetical protein
MQFSKRRLTNSLIKELIQDYAFHFANGDVDKAQDVLESHQSSMRKKDAVLISFFCGLLTMIIFTTAILMFLPMSNHEFFSR